MSEENHIKYKGFVLRDIENKNNPPEPGLNGKGLIVPVQGVSPDGALNVESIVFRFDPTKYTEIEAFHAAVDKLKED